VTRDGFVGSIEFVGFIGFIGFVGFMACSMWARSAYFGVLVSSYPDLVYHGLHFRSELF